MPILLTGPTIDVKIQPGLVLVDYQLDTAPDSLGGTVNLQLWLRRSDGRQVCVAPRDVENWLPIRLVENGGVNRGTFSTELPDGDYLSGTVMLFLDGTHFKQAVGVWDVACAFTVPIEAIPEERIQPIEARDADQDQRLGEIESRLRFLEWCMKRIRVITPGWFRPSTPSKS